MARFRFRLQRVLDVSRQQARLARGELALALAARDQARRGLEEARARLLSGRARLAERLRSGLRPWEWALHAAYLGAQEAAVTEAARALAACEERVAEARARLMERLRAQRSLEVLRGRALARHRQGEARRELRFLDELNVVRWSRSAGG